VTDDRGFDRSHILTGFPATLQLLRCSHARPSPVGPSAGATSHCGAWAPECQTARPGSGSPSPSAGRHRAGARRRMVEAPRASVKRGPDRTVASPRAAVSTGRRRFAGWPPLQDGPTRPSRGIVETVPTPGQLAGAAVPGCAARSAVRHVRRGQRSVRVPAEAPAGASLIPRSGWTRRAG